MQEQRQITIDGPAAAGKSTVARLVADRLNAYYINTGNMYRALTWLALRHNLDPESEPGQVAAMLRSIDLRHLPDPTGRPILHLNRKPLDETMIRSPAVAAKVSFTARIPEVREWLVNRQRETASFGTVVIEGRDIGTVVFPRATHKFFITASPAVRARRRLAQPGEVVDQATIESVANEIAERDEIDRNRPISPLRPAADAEIIDTDQLDAEQVAELIVGHIENHSQPGKDQ